MNNDVSYSLDKNLKLQVAIIKNAILTNLNDAKIFLFGSIAKGCYSKYSDIDLLILTSAKMSTKDLRFLKHSLEDIIETLDIDRKVDIKLYNCDRYEDLCKNICFEKAVQQDLINIVNW